MASEQTGALEAHTFGPPTAQYERPTSQVLPAIILATAVFAAALYAQTRDTGLAATVVAAPLLATVCVLRPAVAVSLAIFLTGALGTLQAFTDIPVNSSIHFVVLALWLAVAWMYLSGRAERSPRLWPVLIPLGVYIVISLIAVPLTTPLSLGFEDFKASTWFLTAVLLLAAAPWEPAAHARIAHGIALLGFAVGVYCVYRWQFGTTPEEALVAQVAQPNVFPVRFNGSFTNAGELAQWGGTLIPFCAAMAFYWRGRWRWIAVAALAALTVAVFASEVRTGIAVAAFGTAVACCLLILSPAFRTRRATATLLAVSLVAIGAGAYTVTVANDPDQADRFSKILTPGDDQAFNERQASWDIAWREIEQQPWGYGLGTAGSVGRNENPGGYVGPQYLDSTYLTVAIEQGLVVMVLYIVALLVLLAGLLTNAIRSRDRQSAALMIGATGALAANTLLFYTGHFNEGPAVLASWIVIGLGVAQITLGPVRAERAA